MASGAFRGTVGAGCRVFALVAALALASGCATAPDMGEDFEAYKDFRQTNDPLEPTNRVIFEINRGLDALLLKPLAIMYKELLPPPFQRGIHNFLRNLRSPVVLANDLLQGEFDRAGTTLARFGINTTLGVGGLDDPATDFGFKHHDEDFGQTLAVWGVGEGPFLMLPVLGPSNPRDGIGKAVDLLFSPLFWWSMSGDSTGTNVGYGVAIMNGIDTRAQILDELDEIERTSLDFYASIRSLYRQNRESEIRQGTGDVDGIGPTFDSFPDFPDDEGEPPAPDKTDSGKL